MKLLTGHSDIAVINLLWNQFRTGRNKLSDV